MRRRELNGSYSGSGQRPVAGFLKHGNERSKSATRESLDQLSYSKDDSNP
jgi:hypothetical protein